MAKTTNDKHYANNGPRIDELLLNPMCYAVFTRVGNINVCAAK